MSVKIIPHLGKGDKSYGVLGVRGALFRAIPEGARFEPELTEEGILFRFVGFKKPAPEIVENVPSWIAEAANGGN